MSTITHKREKRNGKTNHLVPFGLWIYPAIQVSSLVASGKSDKLLTLYARGIGVDGVLKGRIRTEHLGCGGEYREDMDETSVLR